jgi:hypothetical protein
VGKRRRRYQGFDHFSSRLQNHGYGENPKKTTHSDAWRLDKMGNASVKQDK